MASDWNYDIDAAPKDKPLWASYCNSRGKPVAGKAYRRSHGWVSSGWGIRPHAWIDLPKPAPLPKKDTP